MPAESARDVFEVLKHDHQEARDLFAKLEGTSNGAKKTREKLFQQLKDELTRHAKAEEKVFYPALKDKDGQAHEQVEEGIHEHHEVVSLLKKIEKMDVDSDDWLSAVRDLKDKVEHHVQEEENEVFPKARQLLDAEMLGQLGERIEKAKGH